MGANFLRVHYVPIRDRIIWHTQHLLGGLTRDQQHPVHWVDREWYAEQPQDASLSRWPLSACQRDDVLVSEEQAHAAPPRALLALNLTAKIRAKYTASITTDRFEAPQCH